MSNKKSITDFKDLRKAIEEIQKNQPAKTRYQQQAEKMNYMQEAADEKDDKKDSGLLKRKDHAGEEEIKKAYLALGTEAQGSVEYQRGLIQKELAKMGYKTYSKFAFDSIFKFENNTMGLKEGKNLMPDLQKIVDTKGASKVSGITIDMFTASVITKAYAKVNDANKKKMETANIQTLVNLAQKMMGMKEVQEAYSKNPKSGAEVAKLMMKSKTMKGFAVKVKKMKTVTADQLDKMLPDYISGGDIGAMFEEVLDEGKMGDLFLDIQQGATAKDIAKDYPVSLAQAKEFLKDYYGQKKGNRKETISHKCATHVEHALFGTGETVSGQHTLVQEDSGEYKVTHYNVEFSHGIEEMVSVYELNVTKQEDHSHAMAKKAGRKKLKAGWKKEEVEEANDKTAFVKRVKDRFPAVDSYQKKALTKNDFWNRIVQVVKPKNAISSKRYVELGKIFDTGNFANLEKALRDMEKKDGIKEENVKEGTWAIPKTSKEKKRLKDLMKKPIPLGKDGDSAIEAIASLIGDDSLLDDLDSAGKKNPNTDARPIIQKAMKRLGIKEEVSRSEQVKEQRAHAKQSPFKLKSQQYPRAVAIDIEGQGKRHATELDITEACDSFGMITDKELQIEQIQKQLGKQGFISYTTSDLDEVFEDRETQRMIYALESIVEDQDSIEYTRDQIEDKYIMSEEVEFVKPDGQKTAGTVLKLCENTFNVKDKYTGKSFTYKYINEENKVRTFKEISEAKFSAKLIKQAGGIAFDKRYVAGNYTGAQNAIEKLKKGLSDDPKVRELLRIANEAFNNNFFKALATEDQDAYVKFFQSALKKFGVNSPADLDTEKKKEFFNYIDKNYTAKDEEMEEGKYTEYSDLLMMKARIIAKEGPKSNKLPAMNDAIRIAMKKLGVKEDGKRVDGRNTNFREKMRKLGYIKGPSFGNK
jgi:hypothetical protein